MQSREQFKEHIINATKLELTDKARYHAYEEYYPQLFQKIALKTPGNILEIGTGLGGGLLILVSCFPQHRIFGLDNDYSKLSPKISSLNVTLLPEMDQSNRKLKSVLPEDIELVIEDCSHHFKKSIKTFEIVEPFMKRGGTYVIEDVYPEYVSKYKKDGRFEIVDLRHFKNREDDVLAVYTKP
jgi:predicted O-methyltransferase YrrM